MDRLSPIAPAQIFTLVLPVGDIDRARFTAFVKRLQDEVSVVRLSEVASNPSGNGLLLGNKDTEQSALLFYFSTSLPSKWQSAMSPFELFREPLLILGVFDACKNNSSSAIKDTAIAAQHLKERFPRVVHRQIIALEDRSAVLNDERDDVLRVVVAEQTAENSLSKAMSTLSARFLEEFSTYAVAMQASPNIQTPGHMTSGPQRGSRFRDNERRPLSTDSVTNSDSAPSTPTDENAAKPTPFDSRSSIPASLDHMANLNDTPNPRPSSDSQSSDQSGRRARPMSRDQVKMSGFGSGTSQEKLRLRGKSRVSIVLGSIYMMAGHWSEALKLLVEHAAKSRALSDNIWHAKAVENITACVLLHLWLRLDFQMPPIFLQKLDKTAAPSKRFSINHPMDLDIANQDPMTIFASRISDLISFVLSLYRGGEGYLDLPSLAISEASIRFSRLLAILHNNNGVLDSKAFDNLIFIQQNTRGAPTPCLGFGQSHIRKSLISYILHSANMNADDEVTATDRITTLVGIATIYGILGMSRKKAALLRDAITTMTDALMQIRKRGAAELGIHPATSLSADAVTANLVGVIGNDTSIRCILRELAVIYRIQMADVPSLGPTESLPNYGNGEISFRVLGDLLDFCEAYPDVQGNALFAASILRYSTAVGAADTMFGLPTSKYSLDEQCRLANIMRNAIKLSQSLGLPAIELFYWDTFIVRGVVMVAPPAERAVINVSKILNRNSQNQDRGSMNPLLYDPNMHRLDLSDQTDRFILVQGEHLECIVTLQNPFDIPVQIEKIELETDGVDLEAQCDAVTLQARRLQQISVAVCPSAPGEFKIAGCRLKVVNFAEAVFPIIDRPWKPHPDFLLKDFAPQPRQVMPFTKTAQIQNLPERSELQATILPPQPLLELAESSFSGGQLTLMDGESKSLTLTLRNTSIVVASIIDISSTDPRLSRPNPRDISVQPQETHAFQFDLVGTKGSDQIVVSFSYTTSDKSTEYARVLHLRVDLTVKPAISVGTLDIVRINRDQELLLSMDVTNLSEEFLSYECKFPDLAAAEAGGIATKGDLKAGEAHRIQFRLPDEIIPSKPSGNAETITQALLQAIQLVWNCRKRRGTVDLAGHKLNPKTADIFTPPPARISIATINPAPRTLKVGDFTTIRVEINPTTATPLSSPLNLLLHQSTEHGASGLEDTNRIVVCGNKQRVIPLPLSGNNYTVDFTVCPLSAGTIELVATAQPLKASDTSDHPSWRVSQSLLLKVAS